MCMCVRERDPGYSGMFAQPTRGDCSRHRLSSLDTEGFYQWDSARPFKRTKVNNGRTLRGDNVVAAHKTDCP